MNRRDHALRHASAKLAIAERHIREVLEARLMAVESYDDRQAGAELLACVKCGQSYYFVVAQRPPVCGRCRK